MVLFSIATIFLGCIFFMWTIVPYIQIGHFYYELKSGAFSKNQIPTNPNSIFYPQTYVQPSIRYNLTDFLFRSYAEKPAQSSITLIKFAIAKLEETVAYEKNYPNYFLNLGKAYDFLGDLSAPEEKASLQQKAESYYKQALDLVPGNQRIMYAYSINLLNQGRTEEAILMARNALAGDPRVAESHYYLGVILFKGGSNYYDEALAELEKSLDETGGQPDQLVQSIYKEMISYYYHKQDVARFTIVLKRLPRSSDQQEDYQKIMDYIAKNNHLPMLEFVNK